MHHLDYNEKKQHGTPEFPIGFYHVEEQHPRYHMPFHWHMELEIIHIKEGRLQLFLNDEKVCASSGDIVFINTGVLHGGIPENCIYECAVFEPNTLLMHTDPCKQYIRQITNRKIVVFSHFPREDSPFHFAVKRLFGAMEKQDPGYELSAMGALFELFGVIYQENLYEMKESLPNDSQKKITLLKPVLEYIETSYASTITLEDLSRIAGMSPKYFCRFFHTIIHKTPMDYLNYYRIERACSQFSIKDLTVTEIAYNCGFNDSSYFIRTFKRYKGITPKQYSIQIG